MFWSKPKLTQTVEITVTFNDREPMTWQRTRSDLTEPGELYRAMTWWLMFSNRGQQFMECPNGNYVPVHCITNVRVVDITPETK